MSIGCLGTKIGMTQVFNEKGELLPITVIKTDTCYVTQIKTEETCGYNAVQIGFSEINIMKKQKILTKPEIGHLKKQNLPLLRHLKEYKVKNIEEFNIGQKFDTNYFSLGEFINISGKTIGKGNAGNIKKHKFNRGAMTHGSKHHRAQGSLGAGTTPARVFPGKKMPGRLGNTFQTIKNLEIIGLDHEKGLILIKGSVPGKFGNLVSISKS
jgi:large subunit ribosomal protein L3